MQASVAGYASYLDTQMSQPHARWEEVGDQMPASRPGKVSDDLNPIARYVIVPQDAKSVLISMEKR